MHGVGVFTHGKIFTTAREEKKIRRTSGRKNNACRTLRERKIPASRRLLKNQMGSRITIDSQ
jgi:hypothetical protein